MIRKIHPHNIFAVWLCKAQGEWVSTARLLSNMRKHSRFHNKDGTVNEGLVARFHTYMYDIKEHDGGRLETQKEGRNVVAYRLRNWADFTPEGHNTRPRDASGKLRAVSRKGILENKTPLRKILQAA